MTSGEIALSWVVENVVPWFFTIFILALIASCLGVALKFLYELIWGE